jgi:hypothetical protein
LQNLKHLKHNLVEQPITEQLNIVFELQLMHDINVFVLGQFEHDNEQFLQIISLHILQKSEQFIHIIFLHEETLQIIKQFKKQILLLQIEHFDLYLFLLHIRHLLLLFNLILCLLHSFLFLKSMGHIVIEHFLHILTHELHNILSHISHTVSTLLFSQIWHL